MTVSKSALRTYTIPVTQLYNVVGIYKQGSNDRYFPERWSRLRAAPLIPGTRSPADIYQDVVTAVPSLAVSDMIRSPVASLNARMRKRGVQLPGFSGHNFGISIDIDVKGVLASTGWTWTKLKKTLQRVGCTPYAKNSRSTSFESWHWNLLDLSNRGESWGTKGQDVEQWITETYGDSLYTSDWTTIQYALSEFNFYDKDGIDGDPGPLTLAALETFRDSAKLKSGQRGSGILLSQTESRVFASVLAEVEVL